MKKCMTFCLLLAVMFTLSFSAQAMICLPQSGETAYREARVVFIGKVIKNSNSEICGQHIVLLATEDIYKGKPDQEMTINFGDSCSGYGSKPIPEDRYLVFAAPANNTYDVTGQSVTTLSVGNCGRTAPLDAVNQNLKAFLYSQHDFLKDIDARMNSADAPGKELFRRVKAEHFLYWGDFEQAEDVLKEILKDEPDNFWAHSELVRAYYELSQPEKIWKAHEENRKYYSPHSQEEYIRHINFAAFALDKESPSSLIKMTFSGLKKSNQQIKTRFIKDVRLSSSDFRNSSLVGLRMINVNLYLVNLSQADLTNSEIENSSFQSVNFENANLANAKIKNTSIRGSSFKGADLSKAALEQVSLGGSSYDCQTKWPEGFDPKAAGAVNKEACN